MFDKSPKSYTELMGKTNRIAEGTAIKGDIVSQNDFRLDGKLIGNLQCTGKIVIGTAGAVQGDIICKNADIEGVFEGTIQVGELLNVKAKANINGKVICAKLSVEPGASFSASCEMRPTQKNLVLHEQRSEEKK